MSPSELSELSKLSKETTLYLEPTDSGRTAFNYRLLDGSQQLVAKVREVAQSSFRKLWRLVDGPGGSSDHEFVITDPSGSKIFTFRRDGSLKQSNGVLVAPDGVEIGRLNHAGRYKSTAFELLYRDQTVGAVVPAGQGMYEFILNDQLGNDVGRIARDKTKVWSLVRADGMTEPLASLSVAALILLDVTIGHLLSASFLP